MKSTSIQFLFGFFLLLGFGVLKGQSVHFAYDNAGNRISREIVLDPENKQLINENLQSEANINNSLLLQDYLIKIYPNPTQGSLNLIIKDDLGGSFASILVIDMNGKKLFETETSSMESIVDLSKQTKGVYVLQVKIGDKTSEWKIVKE